MDKRGRKRRDRLYRVQTGSLSWKGTVSSVNEAIVAAFAKGLPKHCGELVRVNDGRMWWYMDIPAALKIAGYTVGGASSQSAS